MGREGTQKADDSTDKLREPDSDSDRGEGGGWIKNPENFADVI